MYKSRGQFIDTNVCISHNNMTICSGVFYRIHQIEDDASCDGCEVGGLEVLTV